MQAPRTLTVVTAILFLRCSISCASPCGYRVLVRVLYHLVGSLYYSQRSHCGYRVFVRGWKVLKVVYAFSCVTC